MYDIKDVTFGEDASLTRTGHTPTNFSTIRNIVINTLKREEYDSFSQSILILDGDSKSLFGILVWNFCRLNNLIQ